MLQFTRRARVWPGAAHPLGAAFDGRGVNFALFSANWLNPEGREQRDEDWHFPEARCLGFHLGGDAGELFYSTGGRQELDDGFVVLMSAFHESLGFSLPPDEMGRRWEVVFDTARDGTAGEIYAAASEYSLEPRSVVVLVRRGALPVAARPAAERTAEAGEAAAATPPEPAT